MSSLPSTSSSARDNRSRDPGKLVDKMTRDRRLKKALESLEQDNFQEEPHADLVMSKKAPKFHEILELSPIKEKGSPRKKKSRPLEFYKKYKKTFTQLIEEDAMRRRTDFGYVAATAKPSTVPQRHFCNVCGLPAPYTCTKCGVRYCQVKCFNTHLDTRCLKWTA